MRNRLIIMAIPSAVRLVLHAAVHPGADRHIAMRGMGEPMTDSLRANSPARCAAPTTRQRPWPVATLVSLFLAALAQTGQGQQTGTASNGQLAGSAPAAEVVLKPGDLLRITVWRKPEYSGEFGIATDGTVLHPLYRNMRVAGVSMAELEARFREYLKGLEADPQF